MVVRKIVRRGEREARMMIRRMSRRESIPAHTRHCRAVSMMVDCRLDDDK